MSFNLQYCPNKILDPRLIALTSTYQREKMALEHEDQKRMQLKQHYRHFVAKKTGIVRFDLLSCRLDKPEFYGVMIGSRL